MASEAYRRWISVQTAKGATPSAQEKARFLKQEAESGAANKQAFADESRRRELIASNRASRITGLQSEPILNPEGGDMGEQGTPTGLAAAIDASMNAGNMLGVGKGAAFSGLMTGAMAHQMGANTPQIVKATIIGAAHSVTAPLTVALMANKVGGTSISSGIIGNAIANAYGDEVANELSSVIQGQTEVSSLSEEAQSAMINMEHAAKHSPQSMIAHIEAMIKGQSITDLIDMTKAIHETELTPEDEAIISADIGGVSGVGIGPAGSAASEGAAIGTGIGLGPGSGGSAGDAGIGDDGLGDTY